MTLQEALNELEARGDERVRARNIRSGGGENQFGVKLGDLRKVAKKIKKDQALALELWETGNLDARLLAILVMRPEELSADELDGLVRSNTVAQVADWLSSYVIKDHAEKEALRQRWMAADDPMAARAGWALTASRIAKDPGGLDLAALLDRIESEMGGSPEATQWTMNTALANIGIHHAAHRERAVAIGEALGVYRDYPTSKGCTSPFAPIWIAEMVRRQG